MGLLDYLNTPQGTGLLSGLATYLATARRGAPLNNIGRGLMGGIEGYSTANKDFQQKLAQQKLMEAFNQPQPDRNKLIMAAMGTPGSPFAGEAFKAAIAKPDVTKWQLGERFNPNTGMPEKFMYNPENPSQQMGVGGAQADKIVADNLGGTLQMRGEHSTTPVATLPKTASPDALLTDARDKANGGKPYFQFIGTPEGIVTGNARTGELAMGALGGKPVIKSSDSPVLQGNIARAKGAGKGMGEADVSLSAAQASYPQLDQTVNTLKQLAKDATYTYAGQARDAAVRQLGMGATPGAIAREKYTQTVRDVLFPQLRQTFGAQFTVKEGEALIATMGDPNKSPQEKNAALESFIDQKRQHIQSLQRQTETPVPLSPEEQAYANRRRKSGASDASIAKELNNRAKLQPQKKTIPLDEYLKSQGY